MVTKVSKIEREKYLKQFFSLVRHKIDYDLLNELDNHLNRKLMRNIEYFTNAYKRYHNATKERKIKKDV